ncbi:MAG: ATP synthase F0 subunit B [Desulfuromonas sp.]|nr:MAG: ATP synthase F0 subunit B [Desulfuromonas sp.]
MKSFNCKVLPVALLAVLLTVTTAFAAGGGGHADGGALLKDFIYRCIAFAMTFGIIFYFVRKPAMNALKGRKESIAQQLEEAKQAREDAEAKFAEYDEKLNKAEAEIEQIAAELKKEGEIERDKIIASAGEQAEKIKNEAEKSAAFEIARARAELQQEAARLAVELAEELLKKNVNDKDKSNMVDEYMKKVGELH